jgi:hypothetical protein
VDCTSEDTQDTIEAAPVEVSDEFAAPEKPCADPDAGVPARSALSHRSTHIECSTVPVGVDARVIDPGLVPTFTA